MDTVALLQRQAAEREKWWADLQIFTALALRDSDPGLGFNMAYLFSETDDNRFSVFLGVRNLLWVGLTQNVAIPDNYTNPGYSGFAEWYRALRLEGIPDTAGIFPLTVSGNLNTFSEAQALVRYARDHMFTNVCIVAPPFHMPRAFMSAISVAVREYPELKIYSKPGYVSDWWHEVVKHSQGIVSGTRAELIVSEQERIARYQEKGDLLSFVEIFRYLANRDK